MESIQGFRLVDRVNVEGRALRVNRMIAEQAGQPRPDFVEWGKQYRIESSALVRMVCELEPNGRMCGGEALHDLVAYAERWEPAASEVAGV
jgi:hypothetical protein